MSDGKLTRSIQSTNPVDIYKINNGTAQIITGVDINVDTTDYIISKGGTLGINNLLKVSNTGELTLSDGTNDVSKGTTINYVDLAKIDGITDGTAVANKALILDGSNNLNSGINDFTIDRDLTVKGDITLNGGDLKSSVGIVNLFNDATTINIGGAATDINIGTDTSQKNTLRIGGGGEDLVIINGSLQITGTQTTTNSTIISIKDPILELGDDTASDNLDRGIKFKYNDGSSKIGFFGMDNSANNERFVYLTSATDTGSTFSGTQGTIQANFTTGTLSIINGNITDSSGAISFGDENLSTTGTLASGAITSTGLLTVSSGGATITGDTRIDGNTTVNKLTLQNGTNIIDSSTNDLELITDSNSGTIRLKGNVVVSGTLTSLTTSSNNGIVEYVNTTESTSTTTGCLIAAGGVGIAKNLNVGGSLSVTSNIDGLGDLTMGTITMTGFSVDADGDTVVKSLDATNGGITQTGAIAGATTIDGSGDLTMGTITMTGFSVDADGDTVVKSLDATNGGITQTGAISGATNIDGSGDLTMGTITMTGFSIEADGDTNVKSLNANNGGITQAGAISGATTINASGTLTVSSGGASISGDSTFANDVEITGHLIAGSHTTSDIRYKENIVTLNNSLEKVLSLRGVHYHWIDKEKFNDKLQIGFIAQEVEEICPELVLTKEDGYKAVNYAQSVSLLVEAIKEQNKLIVQLQEEVLLLKNKPKRTYKKKTDENSDN